MEQQESSSSLNELYHVAVMLSHRELPDDVLLKQFVRDRNQAAFTALIERHGPMILGVCRRALPNSQDAEDVCQATFLVLVREAESIRNGTSLSSWLHGVACRLARTFKRDQTRRRKRERGKTHPAANDPASEAGWRELLGILDEELNRLPEQYRAPLILTYLEGLTRDEAAERIGTSSGSLKGLLERARKRLHARLVKRGATLSAAGVASLLTDVTQASSVPPLLAVSLSNSAARLGQGCSLHACGTSSGATALLHGYSLFTASQMKTLLLTTIAILGVAVTGVRLWAQRTDSLEASMEPGRSQVKSPPQPQTPKEANAKGLEIAWGEPTNSICCGLSLHKPKARYSLGGEIHFTFHAQNLGTRKIELPQFTLLRETNDLFKIYDIPWPLTDDFVPIFTDAAGKKIKGVWNTSKYKYDYHTTREIESQQSLALGGIDWHLDSLHLRGVDLKPGKYTVHFENLLLGQQSSTGKIPIEVVAAAKETPAIQTAWGKAVEGIEYGIAFKDKRDSYRIGEQVSFVLKARNVSEKKTSFEFVATLESPAFGMEIGAAPSLENANGEKVHVARCAAGWTLAVYKERKVTLEPGQMTIFGETKFTLCDAYEPHILCEPGTLNVRYDSFALWHLKEHPTGTLKFQVEPAKDFP